MLGGFPPVQLSTSSKQEVRHPACWFHSEKGEATLSSTYSECCFFSFFETGLLYAALAVLELALYTGWPQSWRPRCLCLPGAGTEDVYHYAQPTLYAFFFLSNS